MNISLTKEQCLFIKEYVAKPIQDLGGELYVFGSRALKTNQKYSDLDLLVRVFDHYEKIKIEISKIREFLEDSSFPYKVDLVLESELAESYRLDIINSLVKFS